MILSKHPPGTRLKDSCPVFGAPQKLLGNVLPTYEDVVKFYQFTRNELKSSGNYKGPAVSEINEVLAFRIEEIWKKASIPSVSHNRVL